MTKIFTTPLFGLLITLISFKIGTYIYKKTKISFLNPVLVATLICIGFMIITKIDYSKYKPGGDYIQFFLGPVTVVLAVPLYKQIEKLKKHFFVILIGIFTGTISSIIGVFVLGKVFGLNDTLILSAFPKSITTPIGLELSQQINGNPSITFISILISGFTGPVIAQLMINILSLKNPIAKGIALGTSSHAIGTTKAIELGELEGAMSSLSIGIAGFITVLITPIFIKIFGL